CAGAGASVAAASATRSSCAPRRRSTHSWARPVSTRSPTTATGTASRCATTRRGSSRSRASAIPRREPPASPGREHARSAGAPPAPTPNHSPTRHLRGSVLILCLLRNRAAGLEFEREPVDAAALHGNDAQQPTGELHFLADVRDVAQAGHDVPGDGRVLVHGEREGVALVQVEDGDRAVDEDLAGLDLLDRGRLDLVLVADVAYDLFDQVLERDDARRAAELVDDDGHVHALLLHLPEQPLDVLAVGDVGERADQLGNGLLPIALGAPDLAGEDDAHDAVERAVVDRDAGVARLEDDLGGLVDARIDGHGDDLGARGHDLDGGRLREVEDAAD